MSDHLKMTFSITSSFKAPHVIQLAQIRHWAWNANWFLQAWKLSILTSWEIVFIHLEARMTERLFVNSFPADCAIFVSLNSVSLHLSRPISQNHTYSVSFLLVGTKVWSCFSQSYFHTNLYVPIYFLFQVSFVLFSPV